MSNPQPGDYVEVTSKGKTFKGILMPSKPNITIIKLDNGYNIGLTAESIKILEKHKPLEKRDEEEFLPKDNIVLLGCGGTIGSKIDYRTGAVYPSISPSDLRRSFPELNKWKLSSKMLFSLFSEDMGSEEWVKIAEEVDNSIKEGAEGIVLLHGTDTMSYTAAALSFMIQNPKVPVVLVGAQRSSDRPSSDNRLNLINAVYSATKKFNEVVVCMHATTNDDSCYLHRGTKVRKMHTSRRDAFKSINISPLAKVDHKKESFIQLDTFRTGEYSTHIAMNPNVALIYVHPNMKPEFISKLSEYDGVVFVGTGLGHMPLGVFANKRGIYNEIKELISSDILVSVASQCIYGRISLNVYSNGRALEEIGVIGNGLDWTPETAFVKTSWVLGQTKNIEKAKELLKKNIAGEFSERSWAGDFY